MILWRISVFANLDGLGGLKYSARWHSAGRPIVYAADHPAGALCEMLVHVDSDDLPDTFQLLKVVVPAAVDAREPVLPGNWLEDPAVTRAIGDTWLIQSTALLLRVPSAIVPDAWNFLINPLHPQATALRIESARHVPLDRRLK